MYHYQSKYAMVRISFKRKVINDLYDASSQILFDEAEQDIASRRRRLQSPSPLPTQDIRSDTALEISDISDATSVSSVESLASSEDDLYADMSDSSSSSSSSSSEEDESPTFVQKEDQFPSDVDDILQAIDLVESRRRIQPPIPYPKHSNLYHEMEYWRNTGHDFHF